MINLKKLMGNKQNVSSDDVSQLLPSASVTQDQRQVLFHHLEDLKPDPWREGSDGKSQNKSTQYIVNFLFP